LMGSAHGWMVRVRSCWSRTIRRVSDWIYGRFLACGPGFEGLFGRFRIAGLIPSSEVAG
jgi:hypothetical protein